MSLIYETHHSQESMESYFEAFSCTCIASDISHAFLKRSATEVGRTEVDQDPQDLFIRRTFLQSELSLGLRFIDENDRTARLGRAIVPQLLSILSKYKTKCSLLQSCMIHLVNCVSISPSTFVGDFHYLSGILECCCHLCTDLYSIQDSETCLTVLDFISGFLGISQVQQSLQNHRDLLLYITCGGNQFPGLLTICANIIAKGLDYDDIEGWLSHIPPVQGTKDECWDGDDTAYHGQELLEWFLGYTHIDSDSLNIFLKTIESTLLNQDSPHFKDASLRILEACIVAIPDRFSPYIAMALDYAYHHATQAHLRLQYQCVHFIATLCQSQLGKAEQQQIYGLRTVQCLRNLLNCKCDKVLAMTCFGLVTFCRTFYTSQVYDSSLMRPVLHEILSALITGPLSDERNFLILNHAISAVATLAGISEADFIPFYDRIMPGILLYASVDNDKADERAALHGAAVEAASIIILSVFVDFPDGRSSNLIGLYFD